MDHSAKIKMITTSGRVPFYATEQSSGFDISAYLPDGDVVIKAGERMLVPTGYYFEIPEGYEAQIRARSGLAINHGIGLVNGIGTVDADYRGEWLVPLINWSNEDFVIKDGERIAQVVIAPVCRAEIELVDEIGETERGAGGFGHTGK